MSDDKAPEIVAVDDGPREWTREQHDAVLARLEKRVEALESVVVRWARLGGFIELDPGLRDLAADAFRAPEQRSRALAELDQRMTRGGER